MAEGYFTEAASLMREGGLDPREVFTAHFLWPLCSFCWCLILLASCPFFYLPLFQLIILFPSLLSSNWKYLPSRELVELSGLGECVLKNSIYFNVHLIVSSSLHTVKELAYVVMIFQFLFWYSEYSAWIITSHFSHRGSKQGACFNFFEK